jgi:hypothetical protein
MFYLIERIDFMFCKRCLASLIAPLFVTIFLCAGNFAVMSQDSKPSAGGAVWKDDATGLIWAAKDSGSSLSPNQASDYCSSSRAGGYSDWRLPAIDELEALYDSKLSKLYKAKGSVELSDACVLSKSVNSSGEVWTFCFNSGSRNLGGGSGCGTSGRALCVRGPAK